MKRLKYLLGFALLSAFVLTACNTENSNLSPQEMINTALQEADKTLAYYGEFKLTSNDGTGDYTAKEWVSADDKRRIEMVSEDGTEESIAVNDGENVSMYDKASHTVMVMEIGEEDMNAINGQSPRQQAEQMLEMVKDSHDLSAGEEKEIAGRDTYHIIAKAKDGNSLMGDMDVWIDKETWMPLKTTARSSGFSFVMEYTKIDYKLQMADDLFVFDIPEGATVEVLDEESYSPEEVGIDEVKEELGAFLQVPEMDGLELAGITVTEGMEDRQEFSFDYSKDGMDAFSVIVFKSLTEASDISIGGEEETMVRGKKGTKMEMGEFRALDWDEDGLHYVILIENPELNFDNIEQYIEAMELVE